MIRSVLILTTGTYRGGVDSQSVLLCQLLSDNSYNASIFGLVSQASSFSFLKSRFRLLRTLSRVSSIFLHSFSLLRRVDSTDLIIAMHFDAFISLFFLSLVKPRLLSKTICVVHTDLVSYSSSALNTFYATLLLGFLSRAFRVIFVSNESMTRVIKTFSSPSNNYEFIPNLSKYNSSFSKYDSTPNNPLVLLSISRLVPSKNIDILIRSFGCLKTYFTLDSRLSSKPELFPSLVIAGDGPSIDYLKDLAVELGVLEYIQFVGWVHDPLPLYHRADFLLSASSLEGSPLSIIDCLSLGLPVLACSSPSGITELILSSPNVLPQTISLTSPPLVSSNGVLFPASHNLTPSQQQYLSLVFADFIRSIIVQPASYCFNNVSYPYSSDFILNRWVSLFNLHDK